MHRLVHIAADGTRTSHDVEQIDEATLASTPLGQADGGWSWLDLTAPSDDELRAVAGRFELDRVSRDDLFESQTPKLEMLDGYWLIVVHALAPDIRAVRTVELDIVVGDDWIVSIHHEPLTSIDHVGERIQRAGFAADDPRHLAVRLVEFVGERYLPVLDDLDTQILDLEDEAVEGDPVVLPDIHALRRDVAVMRRMLGPQRRMLELLARSSAELSERAVRDLSDALDHHIRLVDSLDSAHQMVATVLDTYRGAASERMNEVMKVLTVISSIFLPLTLIAGIYGMNFTYMPELARRWGYFACLGAMAVIGITMWIYFVRRGFIGGPRMRDLARPAKAAGRVGRGLASAAVLPLRVTTKATRSALRSGETDRARPARQE